jgi:hypothetical protein
VIVSSTAPFLPQTPNCLTRRYGSDTECF